MLHLISVLSVLWGRPADEGCFLCGTRRWTSGRECLQWNGTTCISPGVPQACLSYTHHLACDWLWTGKIFFLCVCFLSQQNNFECLSSSSCSFACVFSYFQCTRSCGGGVRERRVSCFDTDLNPYPEARCGLDSRPVSVETCNAQPCPRAQCKSYLKWLYCTPIWFDYLW